MTDRFIVRAGAYYDSVTLMLASRDAEEVAGVGFAAAVLATPVNVALLAVQGFVMPADLGANDLVFAVRADDDASADAALAAVERRLAGGGETPGRSDTEIPLRSFRSVARRSPEANLAFVSVPGRYATYEVADALEAGMHVFCFSDGPSVEEEALLKRRALERGLLLMGPDCGTSIIDGVVLGFANRVGRGPVGVIGASGTGIQQVTCLLDGAGVGISHAIGVGGRDLSTEVGGTMTLRALELLAADDQTEIVVVLSKPPDPEVAGVVAAAAGRIGKPVVLGLLGATMPELDAPENVRLAASLETSATAAADIAGAHIEIEVPTPPSTSRDGFIRGLFAGGSLCYEAMGVVAQATGRAVYSNVPLDPAWRLEDAEAGIEHTFIDYGSDELTQGRAHPMIDPTLRNARFEREAEDERVRAIVLDLVLGFGAHPDPATDLAEATERALTRRTDLSVIVALCGTEDDPQDAGAQQARLEKAGAIVMRSAAAAARAALRATGVDDA
ncbi:MAG: FdrA family protein [Actinomycetota bacterium]